MRVAFISNQNNFNYSIVRYLRDRGVDAILILLSNETEDYVYHPKTDSVNTDWTSMIKSVKWGDLSTLEFAKYWISRKKRKKIKEDIEDFDFLVGASVVPAYLDLIGKRLDIFTPMGIDTRGFPFFKIRKSFFTWEDLTYNLRSISQKRGIRGAKSIITGINSDSRITEIKPLGSVIEYSIPSFYTPEYQGDLGKVELGDDFDSFLKVRDQFDFTIVSHNRHAWKNYGNDRLIKAVHHLVNEHNINPLVVFFESGWNIERSKQLIKECGLEQNFFWFPRSPRTTVMAVVKTADLVAIELAPKPILQSGTIFEALALGKPIIQARSAFEFDNDEIDFPPVKLANSIDEIVNQILNFKSNPTEFEQMGERGKSWYKVMIEERSINLFQKLIESSSDK